MPERPQWLGRYAARFLVDSESVQLLSDIVLVDWHVESC